MKKNKSVLILEDDVLIALQIQEELEKIGNVDYHIVDTKSAVQKFLDTQRFQLIIFNLRLIDGWLNVEHIRRLRKVSDQLLLTTGYNDLEFIESMCIKDNVRFLFKPYSLRQLRLAIKM